MLFAPLSQAQTPTIEQQERDFQKRHQQREAEWEKRRAREVQAAQKKEQLKERCASARARIGRLHAERRGSANQTRHIGEIERLGRFVDTQCPPE